MRVDIVFPYVTGRGGMEAASLLLDAEFVRLGLEATWMFPGPAMLAPGWITGLRSEVLYYLGRPVFERSTWDGRALLEGLRSVWRRRPRPDAVLVTTMTGVGVYLLARQALDVFGADAPPLVSWQRASLLPVPPERRRLVTLADAHLVPSHGLGEEIARLDPGKPVEVTGSPIAQEGVTPVPRARRPTFLYVGRIDNRQKRLDRLFAALSRLRSGSFRMVLVGSAATTGSAQEGALRDLARTLGLDDAIVWIPWQDDAWAAIREATALVLTSDYEGFGLVLGEALARGIPVVASDCPHGPRDIVHPGVNGWLFPPQDVDALAGLLQGVVDGSLALPDPEDCRRSVAAFHPRRVAERILAALVRFSGAESGEGRVALGRDAPGPGGDDPLPASPTVLPPSPSGKLETPPPSATSSTRPPSG